MIRRLYSTVTSAPTPARILDIALKHVPEKGFDKALMAGIHEAGYSDATHALFPGGSYDLIQHHLRQQREALSAVADTNASLPSNDKLSLLVKHRLTSGVATLGSRNRLAEALAIMALPTNVPASATELHELADELWYLAGDRSHEFDWYTKRATLSSIYAASELYMTQDVSTGHRSTLDFVDRRLQEMHTVGGTVTGVSEWLKFNSIGMYNVVRSLTT